jgi:PAS domain S-box-containing protein
MVFVKRADDLSFVRANRAAHDFAGFPEGALAGKTDFDIFAPGTAVRQQERDRAVIATGRPWNLPEELFETPRGRRWLRTQTTPVDFPPGKPGYLIWAAEDVTEQHLLRAASAAWREIFDYVDWGIAIARADGTRIERMNPAFARMHGYSVAELEGSSLLDVFAPDARAEVPALLTSAHEHGHITFESVHIRKDGSTFPVLIDATTVKDEQGTGLYTAANVQDISGLKEVEDGLRGARAEADRANKAKREFLSRMSHELRTPLNVILGFAQVLQLDELAPDQAESVDHIVRAGRHLLALIDDILEISRVEAGNIEFAIEPVGLAETAARVLELMKPLAAQSGVTLNNASPDCGYHVSADRQRLKQVLMNLVSNAIKYNVEGGSVTDSCSEDAADIALSVTDTGMGVPPGAMDRLFEPFDRLGREATEIEGTGLGLSLSKGLVEAMGGTISASPNPGGGTMFTVRLPRADAPESRARIALLEADAAGHRTGLVLFIEDNLASFRLVERVLSRRPGVHLLPAMQAGLGLQLARDHHPDLIILDLRLPDMKGEEVLRRLLHDPATASIPVVIASADASPRQVERLLELGARAYLTKPIDVPKLLGLVDEFLPVQGT